MGFHKVNPCSGIVYLIYPGFKHGDYRPPHHVLFPTGPRFTIAVLLAKSGDARG